MSIFRKPINLKQINRIVVFAAASIVITSCSDSSTSITDIIDPGENGEDNSTSAVTVNPASFVTGALLSSEIIDCTLSDGTAGQCYELVTSGSEKSSDQIGPFCPTSTTSTADDAGIWLDGEAVYEANGDFFLDLPNLYGDAYPPADSWIFYDDNGDLNVTTTLEGCEAAARPDVDPAYQSFCVQCSLDDLDSDITTLTFVIPVTPTPAAVINDRLSGDAGISLNGFQIAAEAPVQDILSNWTIAAFDDCGGHVNPNEGYHYHAATGAEGCNSGGTDADGHPVLMGFALDGYGIYGTLADSDEEANSLDQCNGTEHDTFGYHYHAGSAESNQHIGCNYGLTAAVDGEGGGGGGGGGGAINDDVAGGAPDFTDSLAQLNALGYDVTLEQLQDAIGTPPDFVAAAETLNIPYDVLISVLPEPPGGFPEVL